MEKANRLLVDRRGSPRRSCGTGLERLASSRHGKWDHRLPRRTCFSGRMDFTWIRTSSFCGSSVSKQPFISLGDPRRGGFICVCWQERPQQSMITLGINYSRMHDSSACIVRDGELLFAVAEERISRLKHDAGFPKNAIRACLDFAKVGADQLDEVCFGWQTAGPVFRHDLKCYATGKMPLTYLNGLNSTLHFLSMWHQKSGAKKFVQQFGPSKAKMRFVDHHLAHAISAYAYSGFDEAAVVIMDGRGAWEATTIWHGHNGRLDPVLMIPFPDSVGYFYSAFTEFLGFQPNSDEWKVMGLAPYGKPGVDFSAFCCRKAAPYRVHTKQLIT